MNEISKEILETEDAPKPSGFSRLVKLFFRLIATLLVLALLAAGGWNVYRFFYPQGFFYPQETSKDAWEDISPRLEKSERTARELASRIDELVEKLQRQQQAMVDETGRVEAFWEKQEQRISDAIRRMQGSTAVDPRFVALEELEALVKLASQQLALNLETARVIETLTSAERLLAGLDEPDFYQIRVLLNKDLNVLRQAPVVDLHGAFLEIEALKALVGQLPFSLAAYRSSESKAGEKARAEPSSAWSQVLSHLTSLVEIRNHGDNRIRPLLSETEATIVQLRLLVALDTAQFALVTSQSKLYQSNLDAFMVLLDETFDRKSESVRRIKDVVSSLRKVSFVPPLELSGLTFKEIRRVKNELLVPSAPPQGTPPANEMP